MCVLQKFCICRWIHAGGTHIKHAFNIIHKYIAWARAKAYLFFSVPIFFFFGSSLRVYAPNTHTYNNCRKQFKCETRDVIWSSLNCKLGPICVCIRTSSNKYNCQRDNGDIGLDVGYMF